MASRVPRRAAREDDGAGRRRPWRGTRDPLFLLAQKLHRQIRRLFRRRSGVPPDGEPRPAASGAGGRRRVTLSSMARDARPTFSTRAETPSANLSPLSQGVGRPARWRAASRGERRGRTTARDAVVHGAGRATPFFYSRRNSIG